MSAKNVRTTARGGGACSSAGNISLKGMARTKSATGGASARSGATACSPVVERPGVHELREHQRLAYELRWDERQRRREEDVGDHRQLLRRGLGRCDEPGEGLGSRRQREHSTGDHVHPVKPVVEAGDDAEVAAAAPDRPEEVRVALGVDLEHAAVGGHDLGTEQVVDRQTVLAHEVADAAAERESPDPDRSRVTEADGETVRCGSAGDRLPR